jgi:hypothetical protein
MASSRVNLDQDNQSKSSDSSDGQNNSSNQVAKEAKKELNKETIKEEEKAQQKFSDLTQAGTKEIFRVSSAFPYNFFPEIVTVDRTKINYVNKNFISTQQVRVIAIADIAEISVATSPWLASVTIVDKSLTGQPLTIHHLSRSDAITLRRIVQGLIITSKQGIDLSQITGQDLIDKLEEIGSTKVDL